MGKRRRNDGLVRQYTRSEVPRMKWTDELHSSFVRAVDFLGGQDSTSMFFLTSFAWLAADFLSPFFQFITRT